MLSSPAATSDRPWLHRVGIAVQKDRSLRERRCRTRMELPNCWLNGSGWVMTWNLGKFYGIIPNWWFTTPEIRNFIPEKTSAPFPTPFLEVLGSNQSWDATPCARDLRDITAIADGFNFVSRSSGPREVSRTVRDVEKIEKTVKPLLQRHLIDGMLVDLCVMLPCFY